MIKQLFGIPVYTSLVDEDEANTIAEWAESVNVAPAQEQGLTETTAQLGNIHRNGLQDRFDIISVFNRHIDQYLEGVDSPCTHFDITNSWVTLTLPGEFIAPHTHKSKDISGVYYVHAPQDSGALCLYNPNPLADTIKYIETENIQVGTTIEPRAGLLVLFPAGLLHCTQVHRGLDPRLSVVFDVVCNYEK
jgi:uncharacterized protein (TIGR02466 family)